MSKKMTTAKKIQQLIKYSSGKIVAGKLNVSDSILILWSKGRKTPDKVAEEVNKLYKQLKKKKKAS